MMELTIKVNLDNAAFEDNPRELGYVLGQVMPTTPYQHGLVCSLHDSNGNTTGYYQLREKRS